MNNKISDPVEERSNAARRIGFRRWLDEPMVRVLISTLPPSENLELILEAAYHAGFQTGGGSMAVSFLEHVMEEKKKP